MYKKNIVSLILLFTILNLSAQSYDFKKALSQGPNPAGIYSISWNQWHSGKKYSLNKLKNFIAKKGYNLVDYKMNHYDKNKVEGFAFSKHYTNDNLYPFNFELPIANGEESSFTFPNENEYREKAGKHFVSVKIDGSKSKLIYGNDTKVFGTSTPTQYGWKSKYTCDDRILLVYERRDLEMKTLSNRHILHYEFGSSNGAKFKNSYLDFNSSMNLMTSQYINLLNTEMDYILNSSHIDYSKVLVFLIRIQPWLKAQFGRRQPPRNDQNWSKDKHTKNVSRYVINTYYDYFAKMVKNEKPFKKSEDLSSYIRMITRAGGRIWKSDLYKEYLKNKKEELNTLVAKEMSEKMEKDRKLAEEKNIRLRHTFNQGIIGKDYVPPVTGSYNAGKKYKVGDLEIQEEDYRKYVKEGGYNKDVEGYTAVYQIINGSTDYQLVEVDISCTGKFSDIKRRSWLSQLANWTASNYRTDVEQKDIQQNVTYILKPNASLKDQIIVGEDQPVDFILTIPKIVTVDKTWVDQLDLAISGDDKKLVDQYLNDSKASAWHKKITANKNRIIKNLAKEFSQNNINNIKASIEIVDNVLFDKDFDSEVDLIIKNSGDIPLMVIYSCPFKDETIKIDANATFKKRHVIKGINKNKLKVEIKKVARP